MKIRPVVEIAEENSHEHTLWHNDIRRNFGVSAVWFEQKLSVCHDKKHKLYLQSIKNMIESNIYYIINSLIVIELYISSTKDSVYIEASRSLGNNKNTLQSVPKNS